MVSDQVTFTAAEQVEIDKFIAKHGNDVKAVNERDETLLHLAVNEKRMAVVKFLVAEGANVDARNTYGETPLLLLVPCKT